MTDAWPFPGLERAKYRAVLIDPPSKFSGGTKGRPQHYRRMTDKQLAALPIVDLAHPEGCWIFVWSTSAMTWRTFAFVAAWSRPSQRVRPSGRAFLWIKTHRRMGAGRLALFIHPGSMHRGQGYTSRKNAEDLWLFKIGKPKRDAKDVFELIFDAPREHSRKPDETHMRIERLCPGPYAELFARAERPGWDCWGDELGKFPARAAV